jgi:hypothetical protein
MKNTGQTASLDPPANGHDHYKPKMVKTEDLTDAHICWFPPPPPHLKRAKTELQDYLHAIKNPTQQQYDPVSDGRSSHSDNTPRPSEIYIPTPSVLHNLTFLNSLTAEEVWKSAPKAIRTPPHSTNIGQQKGIVVNDGKSTNQHLSPFFKSNQQQHFAPSTSQQNTNATVGTAALSMQHSPNGFVPLPAATVAQQEYHTDDTTVGTTTSNFTQTTHNQNQSIRNARFQELEAQIKNHQNEFKDIHARFDHLNNQLLRNMNIASTHSAQFSQLERQFQEMNTAIQTLLLRTPGNQFQHRAAMITQPRNSPTHPQATSLQFDSNLQHIPTTMESPTPSSSPEKKRIRQTNETSVITNDHAQDQSAQYEEGTPANSDI